jgi:aldose 1-epimerase
VAISRSSFGILSSGEEVSLFTLKSGDFRLTLSDFGATLLSILLPNGRGECIDILLGPATLAGLVSNRPFFGSTVGRFAGRISGSRFSLGGREYKLEANDGPHHLHGGIKGFDKRLWATEAFEEGGNPSLRLTLVSPDGEEGYPGRLEVSAKYSLSSEGQVRALFEAKTDAETVLNLTNHAYFNLRGEGRGDILGHRLRLACSKYLEAGSDLVPNGEIAQVAGGPFDFRSGKLIGADLGSVDGGAAGKGYDHCFIIDREKPGLVEFAKLEEPISGRSMTLSTTLPAVQLYTGNFLSSVDGKRGSVYGKHGGLCLETQFFPDAPNKPAFPSTRLRPGEAWSHETLWSFKA